MNIGDKVYFNLPGIALSGVIESFWEADIELAKVVCEWYGVEKTYYMPVKELRTSFFWWK